MADQQESSPQEQIDVNLRDPKLAGFLAWLWPGAGHIYQRRYAKGVLFMACILGTYFYGLVLGGGHCVYASWTQQDKRWQYFCQLGVGAPCLPAAVQTFRVNSGKSPLFIQNYYYRPDATDDDPNVFRSITKEEAEQEKAAQQDGSESIIYEEAFMAPPGEFLEQQMDLLAHWHKEHTPGFELGTLFTVIAGLLNILAIYDAFAGPATTPTDREDESPPSPDNQKKAKKQAT